MKLYDVQGSPNCRKVRVLARELGIELELVPVDVVRPRDPSYLAQNPTGKVPLLVDGDVTLWESGAILVYLAERAGTDLWPIDSARRADVLRWMFFSATHVQPWLSVLGQERLLKPRRGEATDDAATALAEREVPRFLKTLDEHLATHQFLTGAYSLADITVGCGLEGCEARGVSLAPYAHLSAWRERLRGRASWGA